VTLDTLSTGRYLCTEPDRLGSQGCPARDGGTCDSGLQVIDGVCNVPGSDAVGLAGKDLDHQDVLDQFCRSFFCDDTFVCDRDSGHICVPCDEDAPFGSGGCGTVYIAGAPSCVYTDECDEADASADEPHFGDCTM
jgi:hypothetical protein